jgi:hypothetical protein
MFDAKTIKTKEGLEDAKAKLEQWQTKKQEMTTQLAILENQKELAKQTLNTFGFDKLDGIKELLEKEECELEKQILEINKLITEAKGN